MNGKFFLKGCPSGVTLWMPQNAQKKPPKIKNPAFFIKVQPYLKLNKIKLIMSDDQSKIIKHMKKQENMTHKQEKSRALYSIQEYNSLENMNNVYLLLNKIALTFIKQKSKVMQ